jgi:glycosyltransferase involved in cell wall biosynthesis
MKGMPEKTEALKTGFAMTRGDIVIVQDADLEYDPNEIPEVIKPILEGHADVVYGSRFLVRKATRVLYFYHFLANKVLTFSSNMLTNLNMTDVETGYKAFRGEIIRNMIIKSSGFGFRDRSDCQSCETWMRDLRSAHQLLRTHLRRGKENQYA